MKDDLQQVLDYWFGPVERLNLPKVKTHQKLWFGGIEAIDRDIERRFSPLIRKAILGELDEFANTPEGCLAVVILLDQFPLNIYRDQARGFTLNHLALPYTLKALREGWDEKLPLIQRVFLYLPLEHSEDIHLQEESLRRYRRLVELSSAEDRETYEVFLDFAERHHRVIRRFGRYPDRNPILGRESTPEEKHYLEVEGGPDF